MSGANSNSLEPEARISTVLRRLHVFRVSHLCTHELMGRPPPCMGWLKMLNPEPGLLLLKSLTSVSEAFGLFQAPTASRQQRTK